MALRTFSACTLAALASGAQLAARGAAGAAREQALLQTFDEALGSGSVKDTPVTRVVKLLEEMTKTLQKEMDEDEGLYKKLACWCNSNNYEKDAAITASTAKISELQSNIEGLTAKKSELEGSIKELEAQVAADKQALTEAIEIREKQAKDFHGEETDAVQAIEQLKAAITVLSKHHAALVDSTVAGGAVFKSEEDSWSFLSTKVKGFPWDDQQEKESRTEHSLDDFMRENGFSTPAAAAPKVHQKFLQQASINKDASQEWSAADTLIVKKALKAATTFMQAHHEETYMPAYTAQSGEIMGVLQQLKEEMENNLSESQKEEQGRAGAFEELRNAKRSEIDNGEKMAEQKEDQLADTVNHLAEAKEDLTQEEATLSEDQKFMVNLQGTCAEADKNFEARKNSRLEELTAVAETIKILQADEARDAMSSTYNFLQTGSFTINHQKSSVLLDESEESHRLAAAHALRAMARKSHDPQLSILATSVELDSFTQVIMAIDDMIAMLKVQQSDEVKKSDWCKAELHGNEMTTASTTDLKADLETKIASLASDMKALEDGVSDGQNQIVQLQLDLQRATENRKAENMDFQKTVADQIVTVEVLKKALDKLATYYDLLQTKQSSSDKKQTPPVPQMEYQPNKASTGVMEMIEKLIHEAQGLMKESRQSEAAAQAAYEQSVSDTNGSVEALMKDILVKESANGKAHKDLLQTESDLGDTNKELEGLGKYNDDLHAECDYVLKNFEVRQTARGEEIEALQQAKQILHGASMQ